jgi:4-amino-4-deoxy-L-arabinose transferase-like glycosyltransferase
VSAPAPAAAGRERRERWILFGLALLVLGAGYGLRDPWPADEPRFVLVARQMFESGDWWFPQRGGELYPDKPPLYFWLLSLCYAAIGSWRWSFLLPSLLSGLGVLALGYDLGRRLWNHRAGLLAAAAVLCSLQFAYQFKRAQIDPTLVLLTTLALYGLCRHLLLGPHWRWFWAGCFAAGLGVIAKGVGFLPLLALLPYAWMRWRRWNGLAALGGGSWRWWAGLAAFALPIASWLGPLLWMVANDGDPAHAAYLDNILFKQTAQRYVDPWHHYEPAWYFLEVIGLFWLPFSLAFLWLWRDWKAAFAARDARVWLPLAWGLLVLAFFSASPAKRDMYFLPALPAFALAAAPFLSAWLERAGARRALLGFACALGGLLLALGTLALAGDPEFARELVAERGLGEEARWLWVMLCAVGAIGIAAAAWAGARRAPQAVAVLLVALWCGYGFVAHPVLDASSSARALMQRARDLAGSGIELGLVAWEEQNLLQARPPVAEFGFRAEEDLQLRRATAWLDAAPARRRVFVGWYAGRERPARFSCLDLAAPDAHPAGRANRREWWLLGPHALRGCARAMPEDLP